MAPTLMLTQSVVGPYPTLPLPPASLDLVFNAADNVNGNFFTADPPIIINPATGTTIGGDIILVWNTDTNPHNLTITSQPDVAGRVGDITTYVVGAGVISAFRLSQVVGWTNISGAVTLSADSPLVKIAIIQR
jgi:hypothetical protein